MAYGIKLYNTLGTINLADDSKALRLHDSGEVSVPARTGSLASPPIVAGNMEISITPVNGYAIVELIDRGGTISAIDQWSIDIQFSTIVDYHYTKIKIKSYALAARVVLWKVWVHI